MKKVPNNIEDELFKMHELFYDLCYIINYLTNEKDIYEPDFFEKVKDVLSNKRILKWERNMNSNSNLISNNENSFEEFKDYQEAVKEAYYVLNTLLKKYVDINKIENKNIVSGINYVLSERNLKSLEVNYD